MQSLQEIKGRIDGVKTIRKITKAMQLVSTSKLQRAKKHLNEISEYYQTVFQVFENIIDNIEDMANVFPKNPKQSKLYVVVSSDLGLCGGYNSNLFKLLKEDFNIDKDKIIILGTKGVLHFKLNGYKKNILESYLNIGEKIEPMIVKEITDEIMALFMTAEISEVKIIHTKYINSVTFQTTATKILPIVKKEKMKNELKLNAEFEPDATTVFKKALPLYVSAMILGIAVESKVVEMASRRMAMENATDNADDISSNLSIQYNRARQASITQEITEIVAGVDS